MKNIGRLGMATSILLILWYLLRFLKGSAVDQLAALLLGILILLLFLGVFAATLSPSELPRKRLLRISGILTFAVSISMGISYAMSGDGSRLAWYGDVLSSTFPFVAGLYLFLREAQ